MKKQFYSLGLIPLFLLTGTLPVFAADKNLATNGRNNTSLQKNSVSKKIGGEKNYDVILDVPNLSVESKYQLKN